MLENVRAADSIAAERSVCSSHLYAAARPALARPGGQLAGGAIAKTTDCVVARLQLQDPPPVCERSVESSAPVVQERALLEQGREPSGDGLGVGTGARERVERFHCAPTLSAIEQLLNRRQLHGDLSFAALRSSSCAHGLHAI